MKMAEQVISLLKALRVLIVEDGAIIGSLYIDLMEEMGHTVCAIIATETVVVAAAARCKPDLMIVDVTLSEGSGMSAAEIISATDSFRMCLSAGLPHRCGPHDEARS
ncbi:hypothetical protein [Acidocella facilis]|uniref:hypothetical protein n=1 Tax=Acidocella facilis TaxID=525 RepID=UPI001B8021AB|nr:hypothetical protein [Acidocella facilis]